MFTQIGNTSIGSGYVYQWWLSSLLYYVLIKKKTAHLYGQNVFNAKIDGLIAHFGSSLGYSGIEKEDIYLEGKDMYLEDINLFRRIDGLVKCGFIQSKSTHYNTYSKIKEIKKILCKFYNNFNHKAGLECSFVIASNVAISSMHKKQIKDQSIELRTKLIPTILKIRRVVYAKDSPKLIRYLKANDRVKVVEIIDKYGFVQASEFLRVYDDLGRIMKNIYFLDSISSKNIIDSIDSFGLSVKKEEIFYYTTYKSIRRKQLTLTEDDYGLYDEYSSALNFGGNPKLDIIDGGFVLLGD